MTTIMWRYKYLWSNIFCLLHFKHSNNLLSFCFILFQENTIKSPLSDNNSSNITSLDSKESTFPVNKPLIKLEPSTKMELPIKTEPVDVKPVKLVQPPKPLPIQLPRIKPKPPPVMIVSSQVQLTVTKH